ncbi:hypothetical protein D1007_35356 [Hordeum vulgare]|nr:hypothetical protein D1007_35356 [Hordeum vulgare]
MRDDRRGDLDVVVRPPPGYRLSNGRPESDPHSTFGTRSSQHLDAFQDGVSGPGDFANGVDRKIRLGDDGISRPGGRFWLLSDSDDEEETIANYGWTLEKEVAEIVDVLVPPMDPARHGLQNEDKVEIARRVERRRTAAASLRPWHGPLPNVSLPKLTLSDFFASPWKIVMSKKHRRKSALPAATLRQSASQIASANSNTVNGPLGLTSKK